MVVCVNESGGPCRSPERARTGTAAEPCPQTWREAVTVEWAGAAQRNELNLTISVGERREIRVRPGGAVERALAKLELKADRTRAAPDSTK